MATADDPRLGQLVSDRYRILRRIGEGGMGVVYEAEHVTIRRRVAIKCLHAHLAGKEDIARRFRREAQAVTAIGHRNIVDVTDMGNFDDGGVYMVLEYLDGRDLAAEIARSGPLVIGRLVRIMGQLCDALGAAHHKGIIHRDLKPENVFLIERDGDPDFVKVVDFGISKFRDGLDGAISQMTRTGTTVGTPYYMAPEQAQGHKDVDHRVDIYALGVILFRALTGQHPFDDASYPMLVLKICTEAPPPLRRYRLDVPPELEAVVLRLLAKDRSERPPSCDAVKQLLAPFAGVHVPVELTDAPGTATTTASALSAPARIDSPLARAATAPMTDAGRGSPAPPQGNWQSGPGLPAGSEGGRDAQEAFADEAASHDEDDAREKALVPADPGGRLVRWVLLGAAALTVILLGVFVLTMDRDEPIDTAVQLPEPAPPVVVPLRVPDTGEVGWRWANPLPRAMPSWYGLDVAGPELVVMVGRVGEAARFRSGGLVSWPTGTTQTLHGVAWIGTEAALAVGDGGTIRWLRLTGEPDGIDSGTEAALRDVLALGPTEAIITGDDGTLLRLVGRRVTRIEASTDADLLALHRRGEAVWVVGERGTILRLEGDRLTTERSGTEVTLRAVGGCAEGDLYVAGDDGRLLRRNAEGAWQNVRTTAHDPWAAIACDRGRAALAGLRGDVMLAARDRVVTLSTGSDRSLYAISSARDAPTVIVGDGGRLMGLAEDHVVTLTSGPTGPLRDMDSIGGVMVAVGEWGRIVREQRDGFGETRSPTKSGLASLARLGDDRLLAVGDFGALVEIRYNGTTLLPGPSDDSWRAVVTEGETVLAAGAQGSILRGTPGAFEASRIPDVGDLWALAGTPDDAVAVGDGGVVLRLTPAATRRVPCATAAGLRGVVRDGEDAWIVGQEGTVLRLGPTGCESERRESGDPTFNGVGWGPNGRLLAVGDRGTALERGEDGTWAAADLDAGQASLRAVVRGERDVFVIGAGGVILRHALLVPR